MSYSLGYQSERIYSLVTYREGESECIGIRDEANDAIAKFGNASNEPIVLERWAQFVRGDWGTLYWTERTDAEYPELVLTRRGLSDDGTIESEAVADVDWQTATEAETVATAPAERRAQANALMAMRRREAEANARVEAITAERDRIREAFTTMQRANREELQQLWDNLAEQAEERDWCGEFEEFVANNGGEEYISLESEYEVTLRVTVPKRAGRADESDIAEAIYELDRYGVDSAIADYSAA